jgi:hypothetical protein
MRRSNTQGKLTCQYHYDVGAGAIEQGCGSTRLRQDYKTGGGVEVTCLDCAEFFDPVLEYGSDWESRFVVSGEEE